MERGNGGMVSAKMRLAAARRNGIGMSASGMQQR
jgi:hypothetical protein